MPGTKKAPGKPIRVKVKNQMELLQSQARTERELSGIQLTGVLEFRTGVLEIRDQRLDI